MTPLGVRCQAAHQVSDCLCLGVSQKSGDAARRDTDDPARERDVMLAAAKERTPVVGVRAACAALGLPRSSFYQAQQPARPPAPTQPRPCSHRSLTSEEQQTIRDLLNSERFIDQAPRTIYATLLDEGQYFCSWRTMYRLLKQDDATRERRNQRRRPAYQAPELLATGPCQVWS